MRILLAIDGSSSSDMAAGLVATTQWPPGSAIRIVHVAELGSEALLGVPGVVASADTIERIVLAAREHSDQILSSAALQQSRPGLVVDTVLLEGRPASSIVAAAQDFNANLIVVGSHGRGALGAMLLGSVSAEIVESAGVPVLIARGTSIRRLVLADDGSAAAAAARTLVARMPGFKGLAVRVVSVSNRLPGWTGWLAPEAAEEVQAFEEALESERQRHLLLAEATAGELATAGLIADSIASIGDPGAEILSVAEDFRADLIVMGTRGQTGLARLLMGSVARKVLQHAHTSVLVIRA
jgi:nucleotide-binding universal stress UspA family protein